MSLENNFPATENFTLECQQLRLELTYKPNKVIKDLAKVLSCQISEIPSDLLGQIFKAFFEDCKQLKKKRGGARKRKDIWLETNEECAKFAKMVDSLKPLWKYLIEFFEREGYDSDSQVAVRLTRNFRDLSSACREVPTMLINKAWKRESNRSEGKKIPREVQPFGLALNHAAHEFGFADKYKYETLKKRYEKGKRALAQRTSELPLQP